MLAFPDPALAAAARAEVMAKQQGQGRRGQRLDALALKWAALQTRLQTSIVPARVMKQWLGAAHAASDPAQLGVSLDKLARDCRRARLIRRRYTLLDLLDELGWLDRAIGEVCTPESGLWEIPQRPALMG
jgi:glycerol-1-phosphate dehydrogenase [NAD(P)+]